MTKKRQHPHSHLLRLSRLNAAAPLPAASRLISAEAGVSDPDLVKFDYAEYVSQHEPGRTKLANMETATSHGPLGFDEYHARHWAMEEFFWHGVPGDAWHPLDAYLAENSARFTPAATTQLRRWKEARVGLYEIGDVAQGTVGLQEWDPLTGAHSGPPLRAIALNLGGVGQYSGQRGRINLTYVSPWSPEAGVYCALGYSTMVKKRQAVSEIALVMLGLRQPKLACRPYPWKASDAAEAEAERVWRGREWHGWLAQRLSFPFQAFVRQPPKGEQRIETVTELVPSEPADARNFGIYLTVVLDGGKEAMVSGLTGIIPTELASANWLPIAEYHAYRQWAGPPPGTIGGPAFTRLR